VVARAFLDDPMIRWSLGGTDRDYANRDGLERLATEWFTVMNEVAAERDTMWETEDGGGVCIWLPPEAVADYTEDDLAVRPRLVPLTFDGGSRLASMWDWIDERVPGGRLWFLDLLGVEPCAQGRGIGSALVEHGLAAALEAGEPAFLETGNPRNVAYYERFGFRTTEEADAPLSGPHIWFMRWEP